MLFIDAITVTIDYSYYYYYMHFFAPFALSIPLIRFDLI